MSRPAVFLDRDGTLIVERDYLRDPAGIEFLPGALDALVRLREAGWPYVIVTNQSGIARGRITPDEYRAVAARLQALLERAGVPPLATHHCPHHPSFSGACACRKPGTAMHRAAAANHELDLARSFYIGDKVADVLPALELGGTGILVRTGYGREQEPDVPPGTRVADDLTGAVALVLESPGRE